MELLDIYTKDGLPTGKTLPREGIFGQLGAEERVLLVHICIFNPRGEMLLQQRRPDKDRYPGCWDVSAGGFVTAGESPLTAACRELQEELGLSVRADELQPVCCEPFGPVLDYFYNLYKVPAEEEIRLQESEVAAVEWAGMEEAFSLSRSGQFVDYTEDLLSRLYLSARREN